MTKSGRALRAHARSRATEHTTPPQPASIAAASRASNADASGSLVSTVTAIGTGGVVTGVARAFGESFDAGAQHVDAARGVEVEVAHAVAAEHARGAADRRRDVVQLDVGEHLEVERAHARDRLGPGGRVQLEPDLGDAEPRRDLLGELFGLVEVGDVEREREPVANVVVGRSRS